MRRGVALLSALALAIALGACSSKDKNASNASPTTTSATESSPGSGANAGGTTIKGGNTTSTLSGLDSPGAYADEGDYVNGRHAAFVTAVDASNRTATVDVIQFLTGDAAIKAYKEDTGSNDPPDNDYYIRNQSKQLRTFSVASGADLRVNIVGGYDPSDPQHGHQVDWETFSGYFTGDREGTAKASPFWVTLKAGSATAIQEQFVP